MFSAGVTALRKLIFGLLTAAVLAALPNVSAATGTARIQQADGNVKTYSNVRINIAQQKMSITSSDGKGTLVISKAACSMIGKMIRCYPYAATLEQGGTARPITVVNATVWLNPSGESQQLPRSSMHLPPRGVLLSLQTKAGTYVSLSGTADELKK